MSYNHPVQHPYAAQQHQAQHYAPPYPPQPAYPTQHQQYPTQHPHQPSYAATPPLHPTQPPYQQSQPPAPYDPFRQDYAQRLRELTFNSRPLIQDLSVRAKAQSDQHNWSTMKAIVEEIEAAVLRVGFDLSCFLDRSLVVGSGSGNNYLRRRPLT